MKNSSVRGVPVNREHTTFEFTGTQSDITNIIGKKTIQTEGFVR